MPDKVYGETDDDISQQNVREYLGRAAISNYVEEGMSVTLDGTVPDFDMTAGKLYVIDSTNTYNQDVMITTAARTGVALTDGTTNYVWVCGSLAAGDNDRVTVDVTTTDSEPGDPFGDGTAAVCLKVAEIDTSADTVSEVNRTMPANV